MNNYIKSLFKPTTKTQSERKVWSIPLSTVLIPTLTATNAMGDTAIPHEALGCPLRLGYDKTGQVKFSQSGKPVIRVAKEISDAVRTMRENLVANLMDYTHNVITDHAEAYKAEVQLARIAGEPVYQLDKVNLDNAVKSRALAQAEAIAEAVRQAEAVKAEAEVPTTERELVHA